MPEEMVTRWIGDLQVTIRPNDAACIFLFHFWDNYMWEGGEYIRCGRTRVYGIAETLYWDKRNGMLRSRIFLKKKRRAISL